MVPHRADLRATLVDRDHDDLDCVIELQHSPIDPAEIDERETFYLSRCATMAWILDVSNVKDHFSVSNTVTQGGGATVRGHFRWKWFRQSWTGSRYRSLYLDFSDGLWRVENMSDDGRGEFQTTTYHEFLSAFVESLGHDLPVYWRQTSTGGWIYRFGSGNVVMYQRNDWFQFVTIWDDGAKVFSRRKYRNPEEAKGACEPHLVKMMKA